MPTITTNSATLGDVFPGGQATLQVQFTTWEYSGDFTNASNVTIGITAATSAMGGTGTPVATTSTGVVANGNGLFTYVWNIAPTVPPGDYIATWTGTRANDSVTVTYTQTISVAAFPAGTPEPGVYATVSQYQARTRDTTTPTATIQRRLELASEVIDMAIIGAVYSTNADGMPLNPTLVNALMRATIEQVYWMNENDDDADTKADYTSVTVAGVSYTRSTRQTKNNLPRLAPRAAAILKNAGVLQKAILINW